MKSPIHPASVDELPALMVLIDAIGLFPAREFEATLRDYFAGHLGGDHFMITYGDGEPAGFAYYAAERMTEGTWNLYFIGVHPACRDLGRGTALLRHVEETLAARGERVLLVETSGLPSFERTRAFYRKCGYEREARIRDFYQAGEDKVIFRKTLRAASQGRSVR